MTGVWTIDLFSGSHIVTATLGRFDHAATVGTLGHFHPRSVICCDVIMYQFAAATRAGESLHSHATLRTYIFSHDVTSLLVLDCDRLLLQINLQKQSSNKKG